jgi:hypothetical protein
MNLKEKEETKIYEVLKPNECYLLYLTDDGIEYVGNKNGRTFIALAKFPEETKGVKKETIGKRR